MMLECLREGLSRGRMRQRLGHGSVSSICAVPVWRALGFTLVSSPQMKEIVSWGVSRGGIIEKTVVGKGMRA